MSTKSHIELMLLENVDNLGIVGDVVKVRAGYARNYLLPLSLATVPTEEAKQQVAARRAEVERQLREKRAQQEKLLEQLAGFELTIQRSANEQGILFGSVTQHDIAEALRAEGFNIAEREVRLGEQLKHLDSYMIPVKLADDLRTEIKVWVVSDKPAEELSEEDKPAQPDESAEKQAESAAE